MSWAKSTSPFNKSDNNTTATFSNFSSFNLPFSFSFSFSFFSSSSSFFFLSNIFLTNFLVSHIFFILFCTFLTSSFFFGSSPATFFIAFIVLIWSSLFNCLITFTASCIFSLSSLLSLSVSSILSSFFSSPLPSFFSSGLFSGYFSRSSSIPPTIKLNSSLSNFFFLSFLSSSISFTVSNNSSSLLKTEISSMGSMSDLL